MKLFTNKLHNWLTSLTALECILIALQPLLPNTGWIILLGALSLPGILIMLLLRLTKISRLEFAQYAAGLSLIFIILAGLTANILLPMFGQLKPLSPSTFGPWFSGALGALLAALILRNKKYTYATQLPHITWNALIVAMGLTLLPILSALGAFSLNNGGSSLATMLMFGLTAAAATSLVAFQKHVSSWIWPWAIFTMGLAILWSNSLRGAFITGHDIQLEYYVFQLTDTAQRWSMAHFRDAYNACLSITILPTVLKSLSGFGAYEQYKIVYQMVFAFLATGVYSISRRYASLPVAFISAFVFISFPTFIIDMPMLIRQEIAFGFYIMLLLLLFDRRLPISARRTLMTLFGIGVVLSHYSTTFLAIALLGGAYVLMMPWAIKRARTSKRSKRRSRALTIGSVAVMLLGVIVWTGVYTKTGNNISGQLAKIQQNLPTILHGAVNGEASRYTVIKTAQPTKQDELNRYAAERQAVAQQVFGKDALITDSNKYPLVAVSEPKMPLTQLGDWLNAHMISPSLINSAGKTGYALSIQALIALGVLTIYLYRKQLKMNIEFVALAPVGVAFIALQTMLPMIDYGLFRMLQQDLVFLSLPVTLAALQILKWLRLKSELLRTSIVMSYFSIAFLFLTGFVPQLLGGSSGQLALDNSGFYYDAYNTNGADMATLSWLKQNYQPGYPINSDSFFRMKIMANTAITTIDGLTPGEISRQSYVVLANQNVESNRVSLYANGTLLYYSYPTNFLDDNKDLLYSSEDTRIYK